MLERQAFLLLLTSGLVAGASVSAAQTVYVDRFTDGLLDPAKQFLGPVKDGGHIIANTAPGCWGPMITPHLKGGHEVTVPVEVEGAEVGDAVLIDIKDITITSIATASGNDYWFDGKYKGDPYCAKYHLEKEEFYPETYVDGIGEDAISTSTMEKAPRPSNSQTATQWLSTNRGRLASPWENRQRRRLHRMRSITMRRLRIPASTPSLPSHLRIWLGS